MKLVLFGTGDDCIKCLDILKMQGIVPDFFTDNNPSKWGTLLEGKKIIAPQELLNMDCQIMISTSDFQEKIMRQLKEMGLYHRIIKYTPVFRQYIEKQAKTYVPENPVIHENECILLDAFMGNGWDGDQQYACYIASGLKEQGYDTHVYAKDSLVAQSDKTEPLIDRFPWKKDRYWETLLPILRDMEQRLPFVLIANSLEYAMAAAFILKQKYPDLVRIISVMHNDNYSLYEKQTQWQDSIDMILGISEKIAETLIDPWNIPEKKVSCKINPVFVKDNWNNDALDIGFENESCKDCLRIGWGARLTASQKNAHLLPALIESLEERHVDYCMEIAGDGSFYPNLQTFLEKKGLQGHVRLLGRLEHRAMGDFWKRQHIYINLSEWEGCCLAMLEAMACGTVPVVTNVSGTSDVVFNGQTGFKVNPEEENMINKIADKIAYLAENPEKRIRMSEEALKVVREKCDLDQYMDYMEALIHTNKTYILPKKEMRKS